MRHMANPSKSRPRRRSPAAVPPGASRSVLRAAGVSKDVLRRLGGEKTLGSSPKSALELVELVREGLPYGAWERVAKYLAVSTAEMSDALGISGRTLQRRKERDEALSPEESERLLRVARVHTSASQVLGDDAAASEWLRSPNGGLGGRKPLTLLDTDVGAETVEGVLAQIEDGAVA